MLLFNTLTVPKNALLVYLYIMCICNMYLCSYFYNNKDEIMTKICDLQNSKINMTKNCDKIVNRDFSKKKKKW